MIATSIWNIAIFVVAIIAAAPTNVFTVVNGLVVVVPKFTCSNCVTNTNTALYGRKIKRGNLGNIISNDDDDEDDNGSSMSTTKKTSAGIKTRTRKKASSAAKRNKKKVGNNNKADSTTTKTSVSSALAQWMETTEGLEEDTGVDNNTDSIDNDNKKEQKKGKSQRSRSKQSRRQDQSVIDARQIEIDSTLDRLQEVLEEQTGNVRDILNVVTELLSIDDQLSSSSLSQPSNKSNDIRKLLMSKQRTDYRLAWVGSDDAICHIGTGLHKVPLARMQEVFLNCIGNNRIEILEVISLLGPFPNVKNILQGTTKMINNKGSNTDIQIVMDKMVDGTGKEILAGTDDNIRRVNLQVAFCDERVIVAVVPPEGNKKDKNSNPLDDDGKRVLLFVKEKELDEKLDALRVS